MFITWSCGNCGEELARLAANGDDPRVAALTAEAGDGIIDVDQDGNLAVHLLCEDCLETACPEDESEIEFLREPEIH